MSYMQTISKNLYRYIIVLFLIGLVLRVVLVNYHNNNLGGIEQNVVYGIQQLLLGHPLYQDPSAGNYAIVQYMPLYYYTVAGAARMAGIKGTDVQELYALCRVLALLFNLLTVVVCALIIRTWKYSWYTCFVFAMPVFIVLTSHYYTRGDSMHLLFFTAAIWMYILYSRSRNAGYIIVTALLSACCLMVKQSGILLIGITGFCLLFLQRRLLAAVVYTAVTFIFAYAIARLCIGNDNWHHFYQNAYLGLKNGIEPVFLAEMFFSQFFRDMVPCYVLGGIMGWLAVRKVQDTTFRILAAGAVLSWLFAVATGLKRGSSNNYFMEFLFFVMVAIPYVLQQKEAAQLLTKRFAGLTIQRFAYAALLILITSKTAGLFTGMYIEKRISNNVAEYQREQVLYNYFRDTLHLQHGEHIFFTERRFLDNFFAEYVLLPQHDVLNQVYDASHNTFDYSAITPGVNNGMVQYIVTDEQYDDLNRRGRELPFVQFDKDKFSKIGKAGGYCIYHFNPHLY